MELRGHHDNGRTIAVHSLAVLPEYQKKGLGKIVMKAYVQRMEGAGVAERISLLAHGDMIKFYEGLGFEDKGESGVVFGGGGWRNMVSFPFSLFGGALLWGYVLLMFCYWGG